jgi:hypothetical protein
MDVFIENIRLWFDYKKIFLDKIADYVNEIDNEFILLSADKGKIDTTNDADIISNLLPEASSEILRISNN